MYTENKIQTDCSCGCSEIVISQWQSKDGFEEVCISHRIPSFYALQQPGWIKFKEMVKAIWCFLRGKEYWFYDVVLAHSDQIKKFKESVASLNEDVWYDKQSVK